MNNPYPQTLDSTSIQSTSGGVLRCLTNKIVSFIKSFSRSFPLQEIEREFQPQTRNLNLFAFLSFIVISSRQAWHFRGDAFQDKTSSQQIAYETTAVNCCLICLFYMKLLF